MPDLYAADSGPKTEEKKTVAETMSPSTKYTSLHFDTQDQEETVILLLRRHWVTNIPWMFLSFVFIFAPVVLSSFPLLSFLPGNYQVMAVIMWYLLAMMFVFEHVLSWYFNIYIVTNLHITDITMSSLLSKTSTEAHLEDIQSVKTKVTGVFGSLFNFGDVIIETAAEHQSILFSSVPNPDFVAERIQDLQELTQSGGQHVA